MPIDERLTKASRVQDEIAESGVRDFSLALIGGAIDSIQWGSFLVKLQGGKQGCIKLFEITDALQVRNDRRWIEDVDEGGITLRDCMEVLGGDADATPFHLTDEYAKMLARRERWRSDLERIILNTSHNRVNVMKFMRQNSCYRFLRYGQSMLIEIRVMKGRVREARCPSTRKLITSFWDARFAINGVSREDRKLSWFDADEAESLKKYDIRTIRYGSKQEASAA